MIDSALKMYVTQVEINVQANDLLEETLLELRPLRVYNKTNSDRYQEINSLICKIEEFLFLHTKEKVSGEGLF